jgi:orotate phosphoribosyltransferase
MSTPKQFATKLLQIKALQINLLKPYTWASGWHSPVYCDNRKVLSFPYVRDFVKSELANMILEKFPDAEVIAGVATAGIAHGVMAADLLKLPFIYVRAKPKEHGMGNQIEGVLEKGQKVVVVEDLVSTGKSSLQESDVLRAEGAEVLGMCALFTDGFPTADEAFEKQACHFIPSAIILRSWKYAKSKTHCPRPESYAGTMACRSGQLE